MSLCWFLDCGTYCSCGIFSAIGTSMWGGAQIVQLIKLSSQSTSVSVSHSPKRTLDSCQVFGISFPFTQCEAVTTYRSLIRTPAQLNPLWLYADNRNVFFAKFYKVKSSLTFDIFQSNSPGKFIDGSWLSSVDPLFESLSAFTVFGQQIDSWSMRNWCSWWRLWSLWLLW